MRCESGAGPIFLKAIEGPIRAVTSAGSIQAELSPARRLLFDSDLQTWQGDVTLAVPESQPVTIRPVVDGGGSLVKIRTLDGRIVIQKTRKTNP